MLEHNKVSVLKLNAMYYALKFFGFKAFNKPESDIESTYVKLK